jgi:hypothetical protein
MHQAVVAKGHQQGRAEVAAHASEVAEQQQQQLGLHSCQLRNLIDIGHGIVALREIRKYQKYVDRLIPKLPFRRLVREIVHELCPPKFHYRVHANAVEALHV